MAIKTSWAIRGKLININQLDKDTERGFKCNCTCISCGAQLIAKIGVHKARHFAHHSDSNCSVESIQHQLAKAIIAESISDLFTTAQSNPIYKQFKYRVQLESVDLERQLAGGQLIADCFVNRDNLPFAIEIFYTNRKDAAHIEKYSALGIPVLELDVSGMDLNLSRNELNNFVLHEAPRIWLRNIHAKQVDEPDISEKDSVDEFKLLTDSDAMEVIEKLYKSGRLYNFVGAIGRCGESSSRRTERIEVQSIEGVLEISQEYVLARGYVTKGIPVNILIPIQNLTQREFLMPTLVVNVDIWGSHHRANWFGVDKWKKKLQYQADLAAEKKEKNRLKRLVDKENELKIEHICKMYEQSASLSDFYGILYEHTGLNITTLPFSKCEKIVTNWNCPIAVWRAIVLLVFIRQGKRLDCDDFANDIYMSLSFDWNHEYVKRRSKDVYFWLDKHYQSLGGKRKRLSYHFDKSKLPKEFDSNMVDLIIA